MSRKLSLKQFMHEIAFMAPESLEDEEFMDDWCDKYFKVKYDQELEPKEPRVAA